jgi:HK97 family phage major capsid protein
MKKRLKELNDKAGQLIHDMRGINDLAFAEKRVMSGEESARYDAMEGEFDGVQKEVKRLEKLIENDTFMRQTPNKMGFESDSVLNADEAREAYRAAFFGYVRGKAPDMNILKRDMSEGVAADGGYTVPVDFYAKVIEELNQTVVLRQLASVMSTSSTTLIPTEASIPTFNWIEEKGTYGETDAKFGQISIGAYKLGGIIKISESLLQDSAINIEAYIQRKIVQGLGYNEEQAFIGGDGAGKPTGLKSATVGLTLATATGVAADDIIDFFYSLDQRYRTNAKWLISDDFERAVRKLKDTSGQYLWQPAITAGAPTTILGKAVVNSPFVDALGSNNVPAIFGDYSYYQIADRGGMAVQRLNELYAGTGQVGFRVHTRIDGKLTLPTAVRVLKCGA